MVSRLSCRRRERWSGEYLFRAGDGYTRFSEGLRLRTPAAQQYRAQTKYVRVSAFNYRRGRTIAILEEPVRLATLCWF